ncbi:MAG: biotin synthase BioB [Candidatus Omnitrophota bacterium]|nr:biotin synthase BioB [Candidatus Omnitrophota bacterium]
MMRKLIKGITKRILQGLEISFNDAQPLLSLRPNDLDFLFENANSIRERFRGNRVGLCSITNAKSGGCLEDCAFCSQSNFHHTNIKTYPLITPKGMLGRAKKACETKAHRFCLVTSGCSLTEDELDNICFGLNLIKNKFPDLKLDASLGVISLEDAKKLKQAGLSRYNHNLEACEEFFPKVCTTHTFSARKRTILNLKKAGLEVCCGGIFGLGESEIERLKLGFILKELDVDCIPLNFLNPIPGTRLENNLKPKPLELLKMVAIYRFIHPKKEIKICGGRENNLKRSQAMIFKAGADSIIIGGYLTTRGNPVEKDLEMIKSLGLEV